MGERSFVAVFRDAADAAVMYGLQAGKLLALDRPRGRALKQRFDQQHGPIGLNPHRRRWYTWDRKEPNIP